ncbi:hypothetical protein Y1Q_0018858 [Alligator mississippiensis]|uniref:Uncharacterized protein n=1 Tax=Alligator mississippiensis TaxID=8496 RepID=A0A151M2W6_ALLMI|nr:hypothetical protein Y1Q_0018858 [Alligator mississippiensis]
MNCTPVEPRAPQDHLAIPRAARGHTACFASEPLRSRRAFQLCTPAHFLTGKGKDLSSLTLLSLFFHLGCKDPEEISEDDNCIQLFQELLE